MAGAMRKMAVYLGLVEDDGYDGRGSTPMTTSSPNWTRSPSGTTDGMSRLTSPTAHISPKGTKRCESFSRPRLANPWPVRLRYPRNPAARRASRPWRPSHKNAQAWRRTHR